MDNSHFLVAAALLGFAGLGLGIGLVVGTFVARMLRRYVRDDEDTSKHK